MLPTPRAGPGRAVWPRRAESSRAASRRAGKFFRNCLTCLGGEGSRPAWRGFRTPAGAVVAGQLPAASCRAPAARQGRPLATARGKAWSRYLLCSLRWRPMRMNLRAGRREWLNRKWGVESTGNMQWAGRGGAGLPRVLILSGPANPASGPGQARPGPRRAPAARVHARCTILMRRWSQP